MNTAAITNPEDARMLSEGGKEKWDTIVDHSDGDEPRGGILTKPALMIDNDPPPQTAPMRAKTGEVKSIDEVARSMASGAMKVTTTTPVNTAVEVLLMGRQATAITDIRVLELLSKAENCIGGESPDAKTTVVRIRSVLERLVELLKVEIEGWKYVERTMNAEFPGGWLRGDDVGKMWIDEANDLPPVKANEVEAGVGG